jgi:hypothetical protein
MEAPRNLREFPTQGAALSGESAEQASLNKRSGRLPGAQADRITSAR